MTTKSNPVLETPKTIYLYNCEFTGMGIAEDCIGVALDHKCTAVQYQQLIKESSDERTYLKEKSQNPEMNYQPGLAKAIDEGRLIITAMDLQETFEA